ncbi:hypothetical protein DPMN_036605 [Dreissena polymorpha]|uniref:Uncharacterized protein n=1 Tax=Dreissena polymorpha TaxID=45954 RepID=A0A9D4MDV4_DREPO|nr:hypothetical protein DPMN_036605 [Dreissena polymorpha]
MLKNYFTDLKLTLDKHDIKNKPKHICNVDETGVSLDHNPPKILAKVGRNPHCITSSKSATTTIVVAVSALGETIPPFIIFKGSVYALKSNAMWFPEQCTDLQLLGGQIQVYLENFFQPLYTACNGQTMHSYL